MRKTFKWLMALGGGLIILAVAALVVVPRLVDVQRVKSGLAGSIQDALGRPVKLDGDVRFSILPLPTLHLSGIHVGNPGGFDQRDFLSARSFEVRVKLFPLLRGDVHVVSLTLQNPVIVLERNSDGLGNWEQPRGKTGGTEAVFDPKAFMVGHISLAGGMVVFIDHASGVRREISDVVFDLKNGSLDHPFDIALSAKIQGKTEPLPISLKGTVGPLGTEPGRGTVPFELMLQGPEKLGLSVKGGVTDLAADPAFDMVVRLAPFSPRKILSALGPTDLPPVNVPENLSFETRVTGGKGEVTLADGKLVVDDSHAVLAGAVKKGSGPDANFTIKLDGIDLDRYLPAPSQKAASAQSARDADKPGKGEGAAVLDSPGQAAGAAASKGTGNAPPQPARWSGTVEIARLKVRGVQTQDVRLSLRGGNGVYTADPWNLKLYRGTASGRATVDMKRNIPRSEITVQADGVQAGPLFRDLLKKEPLTGTLQVRLALRAEGANGRDIERTLNGTGDIYVRDGAIQGVSIMDLAKKVESTLTLGQAGGGSGRTDFSELRFPFTLDRGVVNTKNASLVSSLLTAKAAGKADLTTQTLDFRIEPKITAPLKSLGLGQIAGNPGLTVPILVRGSFSSPQFTTDVQGSVQKSVTGGLEKLYKPDGVSGTVSRGLRGVLGN